MSDFFRQIYLDVVCEIIINFNEKNDVNYINERNKNYFCNNLQNVIQDYNKWFSLLLDANININIKLSVIKLCCLCYVHSNT